MKNKITESVARALCVQRGVRDDWEWYIEHAEAAIAAYRKAVGSEAVAWTDADNLGDVDRGEVGMMWPKEDWRPNNHVPLFAAPPAPQQAASIVPDHCSASTFVFVDGCLTVNKDGSGYIVVNEDDFALEDDRDGEGGSVHWITRFPPDQMTALRNFLNGQKFSAPAPIFADASFKYGDLVRKKSGSWWEGRVVGFYSTKQTPEGYDVQMITPDDNGPVQLYPASALEAAPTLEAADDR